jgi:hypothetical protein
MNYTRHDLVQTEATMNQMRNAIYHLARFMNKNGVKNIEERLRRMGQNMARTIYKYWKPIEIVDASNVKDVISTIYQKILKSNVSIEMNEGSRIITVKDYKCALCKYQYEDVDISGCEVLIALIAMFINLISKDSQSPSALFLAPIRVAESKSYGDNLCTLEFNYKIGG